MTQNPIHALKIPIYNTKTPNIQNYISTKSKTFDIFKIVYSQIGKNNSVITCFHISDIFESISVINKGCFPPPRRIIEARRESRLLQKQQ